MVVGVDGVDGAHVIVLVEAEPKLETESATNQHLLITDFSALEYHHKESPAMHKSARNVSIQKCATFSD